MYCKHCGRQISDDSTFCMHCGTQLGRKDMAAQNLGKQVVDAVDRAPLAAKMVLQYQLGKAAMKPFDNLFKNLKQHPHTRKK